jgi:ribosome biogenesis GTPase
MEKIAAETGEELSPGRVLSEARGAYRLATTAGEREAEVAGRLRTIGDPEAFPAVGDWVALRNGDGGGRDLVVAVLPRRSRILRKAAGRTTTAQVVAANLDTVILVTSMNREFNPRRIERFLAVIWESGADPVLALNKADLCEDRGEFVDTAREVAPAVPVHALSARTGEGIRAFEPYLLPACTVGLIGSSGVGKSTLLNRLAGAELMAAREIRETDGKGRHTTSSRELFRLPGGALVIDTPGLREVALWTGEEGVSEVFREVEEAASRCRFSDCRHLSEPGCAVRAAVEDGSISAERVESYRKLLRELLHLKRKQDHRARMEEKRRWKGITKWYRKHKKSRWG